MKKKYIKILTITGVLLNAITVFSQDTGMMEFGATTDDFIFQKDATIDQSESLLLNNFDMSVTSTGAVYLAVANSVNGAGTDVLANNTDDAVLGWFGNGNAAISAAVLQTDSGDEIAINNFNFAYKQVVGEDMVTFTFTGKKDGVAVGTLLLNDPAHNTAINIDLSNPTTGTFKNIDELNITPMTRIYGGFVIDDVSIALAAAVTTSTTVPTDATYLNGESLNFTVNFNENITVDTTGGTPQLALTIGSTSRQAAYVSGSGSNALLFRYIVQNGEVDSDGIEIGALSTNGGTLKNNDNQDAVLDLNNVEDTSNVFIDSTLNSLSPQTSSVNIYKISEDVLRITGLNKSAIITIYNHLGKKVYHTILQTNTNLIDIPQLSTEVYVINIKTNTEIITRKIIL